MAIKKKPRTPKEKLGGKSPVDATRRTPAQKMSFGTKKMASACK